MDFSSAHVGLKSLSYDNGSLAFGNSWLDVQELCGDEVKKDGGVYIKQVKEPGTCKHVEAALMHAEQALPDP